MPISLITLALSMIPHAIEVAKQGQAAWQEFINAKKIATDEALNVQLDFLAQDFIRIKLIAEYEAMH